MSLEQMQVATTIKKLDGTIGMEFVQTERQKIVALGFIFGKKWVESKLLSLDLDDDGYLNDGVTQP